MFMLRKRSERIDMLVAGATHIQLFEKAEKCFFEPGGRKLWEGGGSESERALQSHEEETEQQQNNLKSTIKFLFGYVVI